MGNTKLRAKFLVNSITDFGHGMKRVNLNTVYCNKSNTENNQFSQATPSGSMEMMVTSEAAKNFFTIGKSYYLDFTEAED